MILVMTDYCFLRLRLEQAFFVKQQLTLLCLHSGIEPALVLPHLVPLPIVFV